MVTEVMAGVTEVMVTVAGALVLAGVTEVVGDILIMEDIIVHLIMGVIITHITIMGTAMGITSLTIEEEETQITWQEGAPPEIGQIVTLQEEAHTPALKRIAEV